MDIRLPNLGEDAESGTVASIFVKEGDTVEKDQALIEIESEKAVASIPSTASGTVSKVHVKEGDEIRVGALIVSLQRGDTAGSEPGEDAPSGDARQVPPKRPTMQAIPKPQSPSPPPRELPAGIGPGASPTIRRIARDLGIDLQEIHGTARGGRIVMGDLRDYIARLRQAAAGTAGRYAQPARSAPAPAVDFSRWGPVDVERATAVRRTIAARMTDSWSTVPHVTQFADADITDLTALRKRYVPAYRKKGARLTLTPIILKAAAGVLARHRIVNSSWNESSGEVIFKGYFHIGVAVDTDAGLLVPVLRDVDRKTVFELSKELEELSERARQRKISGDEMQGGTFTVSNQGGIGGAHFTPIINKPEVAILGVGRARELLRQLDGTIQPRIMLPVALSHDHRVIDGADGVRFLVDLIQAVEQFSESDLSLDNEGTGNE